jgi:hypothetical protein
MSEWIEIPRCRVLEVTWPEVSNDFDCLNENGEHCKGTAIYMLRRRRDNRLFKLSRFQPLDAKARDVLYLEEWS